MIEQVLDHFYRDTHPLDNRWKAYPGAYETLTPMEVWVVERAQDGADESAGDVEAPTGWFARVGKWIVITDSVGFHYAYKLDSEAEAVAAYESLDADYCAWADGDEGEPADDWPGDF